MTNVGYNRTSERKYALSAGTALMVMTLAALFSYGLVLGRLVVEGDASATFHNIKSSIALFNAGIMGWLIILICDIVVAWSFYIFLKPLNKLNDALTTNHVLLPRYVFSKFHKIFCS
ncbi:DUF4386 domain-containing protein [Neobacillus ginsengisoli]|uniref:DUF4386 domain-containing protein n=1 Tax=Neobacillus ginsengisoli TaxID=904295 RepID=A0ABT9XUS6_9BACI|nr:DUF4386 domain-containing protein [Neobacillus ginsengisoli]MDQ0199307.1 hypothetical protein [Neobacillus ginsengisoli]